MKFVEMSVIEAFKRFPDLREVFVSFLNDPLYIVRVDESGHIEIGYRSDPEWVIK
jgi:hypothetical protein